MPRKNIKKLLFKPQVQSGLQQQHANETGNNSRRSSTNSSLNGENANLAPNMRKSATYAEESAYARFGSTTLGQITNDLSEDNNSEITTISTGGNNGIGTSQHPANIQLERPGYFTIPSMSDLGQMLNEKGECWVDNFAIGRVDYGCVTFPGATNLANLNLDEIVHIRRKEVHVYPDDTKKPPVGQGLNKPAEITLHRIWPTDKHSKETITDPNRIIMMGYNKKIERATNEMDAQFIDYDPVTGSWTFKVTIERFLRLERLA